METNSIFFSHLTNPNEEKGSKDKGRQYQTEILEISKHPLSTLLGKIQNCIEQEEIFIVPTETVYGVAGSIESSKAIDRIYEVKARPRKNPLILHIGKKEQLEKFVIPPSYTGWERLLELFWPGAMTLLFRAKPNLPWENIAIRMPEAPFLLQALQELDLALVAPSANLSSRPSGTIEEVVIQQFQGKLPLILLDGQTKWGIESTILDIREAKWRILRPGPITWNEVYGISQTLGVELEPMETGVSKVIVPGTQFPHYKIATPLHLLQDRDAIRLWFLANRRSTAQPLRISIALLESDASLIQDIVLSEEGLQVDWVLYPNVFAMTKDFYAKLYDWEKKSLDAILILQPQNLEKNELAFWLSLQERIERSIFS